MLASLAAAVVLAACGGGDDDDSIGDTVAGGGGTTDDGGGAVTAVPASAFASVEAFVAYVAQLGNDETSEPLTLPDVVAPTSDTTEPSA